MSATVAATTFRPAPSYTTLRDATRRGQVVGAEDLPALAGPALMEQETEKRR